MYSYAMMLLMSDALILIHIPHIPDSNML